MAEFGRRWLGRSASSSQEVTSNERLLLPGMNLAAIDEITAEPRRYGFHATLKAPFRLSESLSETEFLDAVQRVATKRCAFALPIMAVREIGGFIALTPETQTSELQDVAESCVRDLDKFRAPMTEDELARRKPEMLSSRQREYLKTWGYPYVFDEYRFHMTLTGPLPDDRRNAVRDALEKLAVPFLTQQTVSDISVFVEPERGQPFIEITRFPLGA